VKAPDSAKAVLTARYVESLGMLLDEANRILVESRCCFSLPPSRLKIAQKIRTAAAKRRQSSDQVAPDSRGVPQADKRSIFGPNTQCMLAHQRSNSRYGRSGIPGSRSVHNCLPLKAWRTS